MNRAKINLKSIAQSTKKKKEWPVVVYCWIVGMTFLGYVIGRIALDVYPHPFHWASALVGGIVGLLVGRVWYRKRGDII
ncbi:MAG: Uncharacterized protein FD147_502 [Chloroflexi bacterium]|nr:MAG: Uncharacterized protein FD147_502 [Chloroflexota bacterium]MBA4376119.1 hypothetical protein [Anaerolinea sp.]